MKLLAYCPHCDKIFQSTFIGDMSPGTTVKGCMEMCPGCGELVQTSDYISNTMYIAGQTFHTTSDAETLKNLLQILQDGQKHNQDIDQIADKIQVLSDKVDHKFDDLAECIRKGKKENKVEMVWALIKNLIPLLLSIIKNLGS